MKKNWKKFLPVAILLLCVIITYISEGKRGSSEQPLNTGNDLWVEAETEESIDVLINSDAEMTISVGDPEMETVIFQNEYEEEEEVSESTGENEDIMIEEVVAQEEILPEETLQVESEELPQTAEVSYRFRNNKLLTQHFEKHGNEFDYATKEEYEAGASAVVNSPDALHKTEKEDGDDVYYIEATNEFVIVATDGYIRTYFKPNGGLDYYNRQ